MKVGASCALALAVASHGTGVAFAAQPDAANFALIIGSNKSPSPAVAPLRYADDDALANDRTARLLGMQTVLLVSPDEDTKALFPRLSATPPASRAALKEALRHLSNEVRKARAAGHTTTLHVFFAGHGDREGGRSFLQLDDARLWPDDLADGVAGVGAEQNHIVIDACHAGEFVGARGPGGRRTSVAPGFSTALSPRWPARTGFLTARSASGQTHEWVEFQGGIFSHEARSALVGGADVNLDGAITYRELAAFVARANAAVPNVKYRPHVVAVPPDGDMDAPIVRLPLGPMVLRVDARPTGHTFVETETGIRLADVHPGPQQELSLRLPTDMGPLFVQRVQPEAEYKVEPNAAVRLSALAPQPVRTRARGAAQESFRQLFALPFDHQVAQAFVPEAQTDVHWQERPVSSTRTAIGWGALGLGAASVLAGAAFGISAHGLTDDAGSDATGIERAQLGDTIDARNRNAIVLISAGLVTAAVGAWLVWWRGERDGNEAL